MTYLLTEIRECRLCKTWASALRPVLFCTLAGNCFNISAVSMRIGERGDLAACSVRSLPKFEKFCNKIIWILTNRRIWSHWASRLRHKSTERYEISTIKDTCYDIMRLFTYGRILILVLQNFVLNLEHSVSNLIFCNS